SLFAYYIPSSLFKKCSLGESTARGFLSVKNRKNKKERRPEMNQRDALVSSAYEKLKSLLPENKRVRIHLTLAEWAEFLGMTEGQVGHRLACFKKNGLLQEIRRERSSPVYEVTETLSNTGPFIYIDAFFLGKNPSWVPESYQKTLSAKIERDQKAGALIKEFNVRFGTKIPCTSTAFTVRATNAVNVLALLEASTENLFNYVQSRKDLQEIPYLFALICSDTFLHQDFALDFKRRKAASVSNSSHFFRFTKNARFYLASEHQLPQIGKFLAEWAASFGKTIDPLTQEEWIVRNNGSRKLSKVFSNFLVQEFNNSLPSNWEDQLRNIMEV
ncbi:MAG: hypothetical protein KKD44_25865, partial [Proteobacteria bacterium]|nr:hypothetical protein [Pseudomonadota bacterium]